MLQVFAELLAKGLLRLIRLPHLPVQIQERHPHTLPPLAEHDSLGEILRDSRDAPKRQNHQTQQANAEQPAAFALQVGFAEDSFYAAITHAPPPELTGQLRGLC